MKRLGWMVLGLTVVAALGLSWWLQRPLPPSPAPVSAPVAVAPAERPAVASPAPPTPPPAPVDLGPLEPQEQPYPVDLNELRRELPTNLYWTTSMPTSDPEVLEARAAESRKWNAQLGKVQAGEASADEVHAYFEHQRQVSQDALDFSAHVLNRYGEQLPERDRGLFELSAKMNRDKLADLPRLEAEAMARKALQDERRAAWQSGGKK